MIHPLLEAAHLTKKYDGVTALDGLNLSINAGDVYCLLGANGAGKSTTINLFLNFTPATAGTASIKGLNVAANPVESKRFLSYIPETVMLYRNFSGIENLDYFTTLATNRRSTRAELLLHLIAAGLRDDQVDQRISTYSKGMRQKVAVAIALAKQSEVLLLDEPTSGLDPQAANEFSELLRMMRERGAAILMATHDLFRAKESGTRVGIMKRGKLVTELNTADIGHSHLESLYLQHMRE